MSDLWTFFISLSDKGIWGIVPSVAIMVGTLAVGLFVVSGVCYAAEKVSDRIRKWRAS